MNELFSCRNFESQVLNELLSSGFVPGDLLCIGVSGGADSICLLQSIVNGLESYLKDFDAFQSVTAVTVNHRIRSEEESGGDCDYVQTVCQELSSNLNKVKLNCYRVELKKGQVLNTAEMRNRGIEDAARYLRYSAFEKYSEKLLDENSDKKRIFFALAHNQNDQMETLIMRFLSGAGTNSRGGILQERCVSLSQNREVKYVRPLLNISRLQIENYLNQKNIQWRTDSTNNDNSYLRNKIRNIVIPILDKNFEGWKTGLVSGSQKAVRENSFIEKSISHIFWKIGQDGIFMDIKSFEELDFVQKERVLYKGFDLLKAGDRIPFAFVEQIASGNYDYQKNGIVCVHEGTELWLKKLKNYATIYGFFDIIEEDGLYKFDFGNLTVKNAESGSADLEFVTNSRQVHYLNEVPVPFVFRSRQLADSVLTKERSKKSLSDVLSDFKVCVEHKNIIPVIEHQGEILAVWGSIFGYSNWIV